MWFFHKISFWEVELKHFLFNDDNVWLSTKSPQLQKRTKLQTWSKLHQAICVLIRRCVVLLSIFSASFFDIRLNFLWRFLNSCEWHAQIMIHWHSYFYILFFGWHFFVKNRISSHFIELDVIQIMQFYSNLSPFDWQIDVDERQR